MLMGFMLFDEPQLDRCPFKAIYIAQFALHKTTVTPMDELGMCAKDLKSGRWIVVFLYHVIEFRLTVFEASRRVLNDNVSEPLVKLSGWDASFAVFNNLKDKIK